MLPLYADYENQKWQSALEECQQRGHLRKAIRGLQHLLSIPPTRRPRRYERDLAHAYFQLAIENMAMTRFVAARHRFSWFRRVDRYIYLAELLFLHLRLPHAQVMAACCAALRALSKVRQGDHEAALEDISAVLEQLEAREFAAHPQLLKLLAAGISECTPPMLQNDLLDDRPAELFKALQRAMVVNWLGNQ